MASHSGSSDSGALSRTTSNLARNSETPHDDAELRKARKREQDRLCQRRKREKDRENLRRLEARLNGLQNSDEPKAILDLILRHEKDQAKLSRQADRLRQIESLLQTSLQDMNDDAPPTTTVPKAAEARSETGDSKQAVLESITSEAQPPAPLIDRPVQMPPSASYSSCGDPVTTPFVTSHLHLHPGIGPEPAHAYAYSQSGTASCPPSPTPSNVISEAFLQVRNFNTTELALSDDTTDQHIVVMIMLHGWDAVAAHVQLDPLWCLLRQTDSAASSLWRKVDRMVGMLSMRRTMKANVLGSQSALEPKFLRPRPSQLHVPHFPSGDYFPWPGVRERFVFESHKYAHDTFLSIFNANAHFIWNADFGASFTQDDRHMFQFSPELMKRFNELKYWTVDASFIAAYPEFAGDIPTYNSVPPTVERGWDVCYFEGEEKDEANKLQTHAQAQAQAQLNTQVYPLQAQPTVQGQWAFEDRRWCVASGVR